MHNRKNMEFFSRIVREVLLFISFSYTLQQNELRIKTGYVSVNFSLSSKRLSQFSGCTKSWRVLGLRTFFGVQLFFDTVLVRKPSVSHLEKLAFALSCFSDFAWPRFMFAFSTIWEIQKRLRAIATLPRWHTKLKSKKNSAEAQMLKISIFMTQKFYWPFTFAVHGCDLLLLKIENWIDFEKCFFCFNFSAFQ